MENDMQEMLVTHDRWHVGKEIPIALILAFGLQTGAFIWWAASLSSKVDHLAENVKEMKDERYTKEDGRRDREFMMQINATHFARDSEQDRRISILEAFHQQQPLLKGR